MNKLTLLRNIVQQVGFARELDEASRIIAQQVKAATKADVCTVFITEKDAHQHRLMACEGIDLNPYGPLVLAMDEGLVGAVAQRSELINVGNAVLHECYSPVDWEKGLFGFLGVPIVYQGELLGVIVLQRLTKRRFPAADEAFLVTLAAQLAGKIILARTNTALNRPDSSKTPTSNVIEGVVGAPGIATGVAVVVYAPTELDQVPDQVPEDIDIECKSLLAAIEVVASEFEIIAQQTTNNLSIDERSLFDAYAMIVRSSEIREATLTRIRAGNWAPGALRGAIQEYVQIFEAMDDPYFRERAKDIRDIGCRLLAQLLISEKVELVYPEKTVLVGENLSPIDLMNVPEGQLVAVVSGHGSGLSHLSILARAHGIPAVMGLSTQLSLRELESKAVIIDGYEGRLYIEPSAAIIKQFSSLQQQESQLTDALNELKGLPSQTLDGHKITLLTNAGLLSDLSHSTQAGAEGIGLYRTEFPFMVQSSFPTEDEQQQLYRSVLEAMAPHPVTLRTLDIGGDKPLPYFPVIESNPYLGWRGIRISLDHPEIFLTQIRALLKASIGLNNLKILFPMISRIEDLDEALLLLDKAQSQLSDEGIQIKKPIVGAMIEVPSAVYIAESIAQRVDFISIGTNDLTQYFLAVDRNNERVSRWFDTLNPSVINAINQVVEAGHQLKTPVCVCGEAAGDPTVALLLMGMGVESLSLSAGDLLRIKWLIRSFTRQEAQQLLEKALTEPKASTIKQQLVRAIEAKGLGSLLRAGK